MNPTSSSETESQYKDLITQLLSEFPIQESQMFGVACVKLGSKAAFGIWGDAVVFKLSPEAAEKTLAIPGTTQFDPMGGRPMKQWIVVPFEQRSEWLTLGRQAIQSLADAK